MNEPHVRKWYRPLCAKGLGEQKERVLRVAGRRKERGGPHEHSSQIRPESSGASPFSAQVYVLFTHCAAIWPPDREPPPLMEQANCFTPWGAYSIAMAKMAKAHTIAYAAVRAAGLSETRVGVAHNVRDTSW